MEEENTNTLKSPIKEPPAENRTNFKLIFVESKLLFLILNTGLFYNSCFTCSNLHICSLHMTPSPTHS